MRKVNLKLLRKIYTLKSPDRGDQEGAQDYTYKLTIVIRTVKSRSIDKLAGHAFSKVIVAYVVAPAAFLIARHRSTTLRIDMLVWG